MTAPSAIDQKPGPSEQTATPVRLGCVSYLNTLPLIEGLGKLRDLRLTLTAPARLIDLLVADEIDMGLLSLIDYQRAPEAQPLALLPVGMIGCDGPTMTVRLFSSVPIEKITEVHADIDSHTSTALLRIILAKRFGITPPLVDFDAEAHRTEREVAARAGRPEPWPKALLVIGDKVVTDSPPAIRYPHQLDLGEAWKELTGLPFVYAMWMCRRGTEGSLAARTTMAVLDRQRRHNATRLEWIVQHRAPVRGWPENDARAYLGDLLRFEVSPAHRQAVELFFDLAHEHKIIDERRESVWAEV